MVAEYYSNYSAIFVDLLETEKVRSGNINTDYILSPLVLVREGGVTYPPRSKPSDVESYKSLLPVFKVIQSEMTYRVSVSSRIRNTREAKNTRIPAESPG